MRWDTTGVTTAYGANPRKLVPEAKRSMVTSDAEAQAGIASTTGRVS
jgi:hypothetical protein